MVAPKDPVEATASSSSAAAGAAAAGAVEAAAYDAGNVIFVRGRAAATKQCRCIKAGGGVRKKGVFIAKQNT